MIGKEMNQRPFPRYFWNCVVKFRFLEFFFKKTLRSLAAETLRGAQPPLALPPPPRFPRHRISNMLCPRLYLNLLILRCIIQSAVTTVSTVQHKNRPTTPPAIRQPSTTPSDSARLMYFGLGPLPSARVVCGSPNYVFLCYRQYNAHNLVH